MRLSCLSPNLCGCEINWRRRYRVKKFYPFSPGSVIPADVGPLEVVMKPGYKEDTGKTRYDLLPPEFLDAVATILTYGVEKRGYPERNWEAGMDWGRPFAATQRHLWAWWEGEDEDESGYSHLWHAACELAFLIAFEARGVGEDDRPTTEPASTLNHKVNCCSSDANYLKPCKSCIATCPVCNLKEWA